MNQNSSSYLDGLFTSGSLPSAAEILLIIVLIWILFTLVGVSGTLKAFLEEYRQQEDNKNSNVASGSNPRRDTFADIDEDEKS